MLCPLCTFGSDDVMARLAAPYAGDNVHSKLLPSLALGGTLWQGSVHAIGVKRGAKPVARGRC